LTRYTTSPSTTTDRPAASKGVNACWRRRVGGEEQEEEEEEEEEG
jgi:hypothetical protein